MYAQRLQTEQGSSDKKGIFSKDKQKPTKVIKFKFLILLLFYSFYITIITIRDVNTILLLSSIRQI